MSVPRHFWHSAFALAVCSGTLQNLEIPPRASCGRGLRKSASKRVDATRVPVPLALAFLYRCQPSSHDTGTCRLVELRTKISFPPLFVSLPSLLPFRRSRFHSYYTHPVLIFTACCTLFRIHWNAGLNDDVVIFSELCLISIYCSVSDRCFSPLCTCGKHCSLHAEVALQNDENSPAICLAV